MILRGIFVFIGSAALSQFHQLLLGFGLILYVASYGILFDGGDDDDEVGGYGDTLNNDTDSYTHQHHRPRRLSIIMLMCCCL